MYFIVIMTIVKHCIPKSKFISCDANKVFYFEHFLRMATLLSNNFSYYLLIKLQLSKCKYKKLFIWNPLNEILLLETRRPTFISPTPEKENKDMATLQIGLKFIKWCFIKENGSILSKFDLLPATFFFLLINPNTLNRLPSLYVFWD